MKTKDRIKGTYYGWFFGPGALLRKGLDDNYVNIQKNPEWSKINKFEEIPSDNKMYDQLTQTRIVHEILMKNNKISPELFKDYLLKLNKKDDILNNDQYGPSTQKAVRKLLAGENPRETGKRGYTTGASMRCMPVAVYFKDDKEKLIKNTVESSIISHNTDVAISGALSVNLMLYFLLNGNPKEKALQETLKTLGETYGKYGEPTAFAHMYSRIKDAVKFVKGKSTNDAIEIIAKKVGFSWYAIEQIPAAFAIYFVAKNPKEAELMAFKIGYGHTAPQIACAFYGAEKGPEIFPKEVLEKIETVNDIDIDKMVNEISK